MKSKLLNAIKASWPYLLTLIIGLYLAEILAGSVMALSRYKLTFADHMPTVLTQLALHPWHYYNLYLGQKNPVLIIVSVAVILYTIYFALKRNSKHKAWKTADTETHGSATWGDLKELSDHYFSINAKDLTTAFNKSIATEILEALTQQEVQSKTNKWREVRIMNRPDLLVRIATIIALLIAIVLFLFQGWSTPTFVFAVITVILSFIYQLIRLQIKKR